MGDGNIINDNIINSGIRIAEQLGSSAQGIYAIGRGYFWDQGSKTVLRKPGAIAPPPPLNREARRECQRQAARLDRKEARLEDKAWEELSAAVGENAAGKEASAEELSAALAIAGRHGILHFFKIMTRRIAAEMCAGPVLRSRYLAENGFTRNRAIELADVLFFLLCMGGSSMNREMYDYFKNGGGLPSVPAMAQAREKLKAEGVEYYGGRITAIASAMQRHLPSFKKEGVGAGFGNIYACDGTAINIACNPMDEETHIGGKDGSKGFNQLHVTAIREHRTGAFVACRIQPARKLNETGAVTDMINEMEIAEDSLLTGDRGFGGLSLIETVIRKEHLDCLIRVREDWIKETEALGCKGQDVDIAIHVIATQRKCDKERVKAGRAKYLSGRSGFGKYKASQTWDFESEASVGFRVVRFLLESGEWETLVTTLPGEKYGMEELKKLYHMRWNNIEKGFRILKWDNHLAQLHSRLDNSVRQEIHARMAMHNIVSCVIAVAESVGCVEESIMQAEGCKYGKGRANARNHRKTINRHFATYLVCDFMRGASDEVLQIDVIRTLLRNKIPVRDGRSYERSMRAIGFACFGYRT